MQRQAAGGVAVGAAWLIKRSRRQRARGGSAWDPRGASEAREEADESEWQERAVRVEKRTESTRRRRRGRKRETEASTAERGAAQDGAQRRSRARTLGSLDGGQSKEELP